MPTRSQTVTTTPIEVASLTDNVTYRGWCQGSRRLFLANVARAPEADGPAVSLRPGESMTFRATATENVYVWGEHPGTELVYREEPA